MLNLANIVDIKFDGINHSDAPDYCDAYISDAWLEIGVEEFNQTTMPTNNRGFKLYRQLSEDELDWLNDQRDFVYEKLMDEIH